MRSDFQKNHDGVDNIQAAPFASARTACDATSINGGVRLEPAIEMAQGRP
jgi:hypothetical protein